MQARWSRAGVLPAFLAWLLLAPALAAGQSGTPTGPGEHERVLARAEAALAAGAVAEAGSLLERVLVRAPDDASALLLMGRVELARGKGHRFRALQAFRRAARLRPDDPAPHYWIGRAGMELLGADGAAIARRGLERAIALDPHHADAWALWTGLYRGPRERARMLDLLRPHAADPEVRARIAWLLVEDEACAAADSILEDLARETPDPRWPAWRADCAFQQREDERGLQLYTEALAAAAADSTDALWAQVAAIARPAERERYRALPPEGRPAFYRAFWAYRDPNLFTPQNERIGEHFRRRAEARRRFHLREPLALYHHSATYRRNVSASGPGALPELAELEPLVLVPGRNLPDQLDDRGLAFLRHGEPDRRNVLSLDEETWHYGGDPPLELRFARVLGPAPMTDMIFRPPTGSHLEAVALAMATDRSSLPAPLEFAFWFARFRAGAEADRTELVLVLDSLAAAAALFSATGEEVARGRAGPGGVLRLEAPPGRYLLALDAARGDSLGRYRGRVTLPDYGQAGLRASDILLAHPGPRDPADRDAVFARAVPDLELSAGEPFTLYLEIYGLRIEEGVARYRVEYEFSPRQGALGRLLRRREPIVLRYERSQEAAPGERIVHGVEIEPGRLPPGAYDVTVRVTDVVSGVQTAAGELRIEVR